MKLRLSFALPLVAGLLLTLYLAGFTRLHYGEPITLSGDHTFILNSIRETMDGVFRFNDRMGAPWYKDGFYFPLFDFTYKLIAWAFSFFTSNVFLICQLLYLVGVSLIFVFCYWALNLIGVSSLLSAVGSIAFTISPYFLFRSVAHDALSLYYSVPLGAALPLVLSRDDPPLEIRQTLCSPFAITATLLCGTSGLYYGVFTSIFVMFGSLVMAGERRRLSPVVGGAIVAVTIIILLLVTTYGSYIFELITNSTTRPPAREASEQLTHGLYPAAAMRVFNDVGLWHEKFAQYLSVTAIPTNFGAPGEGMFPEWPGPMLTTIILAAPVLLALGLFVRDRSTRLIVFALLLLTFGVAFSTRGGLGYVFNYVLIGALRAQERVMPFLMFYALAILFLSLQLLWLRHRAACISSSVAATGLLFFGVYPAIFTLSGKQASFLNDPDAVDNFRSLQQMLGARAQANASTTLQLPIFYWPEHPAMGPFSGYEHQLPYIMDKPNMPSRWSYGLALQQPEYQRLLTSIGEPGSPGFLTRVRGRGYDSILIEFNGYHETGGKDLVEMYSSEGGCVIFEDEFRALIGLSNSGTDGCKKARERPLEMKFKSGSDDAALLFEGWSVPEASGTWSLGPSSKLLLKMPSKPGPHSVSLVFTVFRALTKTKTIKILSGGNVLFQRTIGPNDPSKLSAKFQMEGIDANFQIITIECDQPESPTALGSADARILGVMLHSAKVE